MLATYGINQSFSLIISMDYHLNDTRHMYNRLKCIKANHPKSQIIVTVVCTCHMGHKHVILSCVSLSICPGKIFITIAVKYGIHNY